MTNDQSISSNMSNRVLLLLIRVKYAQINYRVIRVHFDINYATLYIFYCLSLYNKLFELN